MYMQPINLVCKNVPTNDEQTFAGLIALGRDRTGPPVGAGYGEFDQTIREDPLRLFRG